MEETEFRQLIDNIAHDGILSSVPVIADVEGKLVVLSGNHRVQASVEAGLTEIDVMEIQGEIETYLPEQRRIAIQLSHNQIVGKDNPVILNNLYNKLELPEKIYSGITDDYLNLLQGANVSGLSLGGVKYQEVVISFLPEDREEFLNLIKRIEKGSQDKIVLAAHLNDFAEFFNTLVEIKNKKNVYNTAIAINVMAQLAMERLEQITAEDTAQTEDK